jgi:hypothetical protein
MNMRIKMLVPVGMTALFLTAAGCDVEKTQEGEMPDVDVSADAGQLPKYEVEKTQEGRMPDVDVDVEGGQLPEYDVDGPDIDIEKKTVEVPTIDIDPAGDDELDEEIEDSE